MRPPWRETFPSGSKAAAEFYAGNADFFDHVRDAGDGVRDFLDGTDDSRGRRVTETAAGRKILSARSSKAKIIGALEVIFRGSPTRKWEDVEWSELERLHAALEPYYEPYSPNEAQNPSLYWVPLALADESTIAALSSAEQNQWYAWQSRARIMELVGRIDAALKRNGKRLTARQRKAVSNRVAEWRRWSKDAAKIPSYACEPSERDGGMTCDYPEIEGELARIEAAATGKAYSADWAEAERGKPGFQDALNDEEQPFLPIEAFEMDEPEGRCSVHEAAQILGRASAAKRKAAPKKKKTSKRTKQVVMGRVV
jgi:hypothetical protein